MDSAALTDSFAAPKRTAKTTPLQVLGPEGQQGMEGMAMPAMANPAAAPTPTPGWRFSAPAYASGEEQEQRVSGQFAAGTPSPPSPLDLNVRAYGLALVATSLVFAYLWISAETRYGTWWRPAWYAVALVQAVLAGMLLCAAGGGVRRGWGPPLGATLLPFAAPLIFVALLEMHLAEPDGGDAQKRWTVWAGRAVAVVSLLSAGAAAGLYWRARGRKA